MDPDDDRFKKEPFYISDGVKLTILKLQKLKDL